jgi:hypothetical protein
MRKNRKVKGRRALNLGLNPHSKGLIFSDWKTNFFLTRLPRINNNELKNALIKKTEIK